MCGAVYLLRDLLLLSSFLSSQKVISRRQEAYLGDSKCSSVGSVSGAFPILDFRGVDAGGNCTGGTNGGASAGCVDAGDGNGRDGTTKVSLGRERRHPNRGCTRSGGGACC
jgi:hypothetical protein